jgi:hypothetical protein
MNQRSNNYNNDRHSMTSELIKQMTRMSAQDDTLLMADSAMRSITPEEGIRMFDYCRDLMMELKATKENGTNRVNGEEDIGTAHLSDIEKQSNFLFRERSDSCEVSRTGTITRLVKVKREGMSNDRVMVEHQELQ